MPILIFPNDLDIRLGEFEIPINPLIVLLIEFILISCLLLGWYFGARRLEINLHHWMVYGSTSTNLVIVLLWMLPHALNALPNVLSDPLGRILPLAHFTSGIIAVSLSSVLVIIFLYRKDIPLSVLRKARPLMILTLIFWLIAFIIGLINFSNIYLQPPSPYY